MNLSIYLIISYMNSYSFNDYILIFDSDECFGSHCVNEPGSV